MPEQDRINEREFELMTSMKSFFSRPFDFVDLDKEIFPDTDYQLKYEFSRQHSYL